jgi:hypothetical protein
VNRVTIHTITYDPTHDEYVLYLVEDGPWPSDDNSWAETLAQIQDRIFGAIEVAIDGRLQEQYPDSSDKSVRIQVDSPSGIPAFLIDFVATIRNHIKSDDECRTAIASSQYASHRSMLEVCE